MLVLGIAGYSGSGKTTLVEKLIPLLNNAGLTVSTIKHSHHNLALDQPGKDSWRHSQAGATEVLLASAKGWTLFHQHAHQASLNPYQLIAALVTPVDLVLVEGFKLAALPKIEVWRQSSDTMPLYLTDDNVLAVASDVPDLLTTTNKIQYLDLNQPRQIVQWIVAKQQLFNYLPVDR